MRKTLLIGLMLLAACGREQADHDRHALGHRPDHERRAGDAGAHAFRTFDHVGKARHEKAFIETCRAMDSASSREPDPRSRRAFEGLIRMARGEPLEGRTVFAPGFKIEPVVDHDIVHQPKLGDFTEVLKNAVAVDYRSSIGSGSGGTHGFRYLTVSASFGTAGGGNDYLPISYDVYRCGDILVDLHFDGPTQMFWISSLRFGQHQVWRTIRHVGDRITSEKSVAMTNEWLRTKRLPTGY